jgi:hypothetical protein
LDFVFYAIFHFESLDLGWYVQFREGLYNAPGALVNKSRMLAHKIRDFLLLTAALIIAICCYNANGSTVDSASNNPLLDGVEPNDEANLPPPYMVSLSAQNIHCCEAHRNG